jgi:cell division protein FtsZ
VTPRAPELVMTPEPVAAVAAEPQFSMEAREEEQPDIFSAPQAAEAAPIHAEPEIVAPVARIVDPAAAEADDMEDEPLFAEPAFEPRRPRGGFLSIFGGRPRYDSAPALAQSAPTARATTPAPVRGGAQPLEAQLPQDDVDQNEDLEIPSFLRRLAN